MLRVWRFRFLNIEKDIPKKQQTNEKTKTNRNSYKNKYIKKQTEK